MKGQTDGSEVSGVDAAVPTSLGGSTTQESMPVHKRNRGFRGGWQRGIMNIDEGNEGCSRHGKSFRRWITFWKFDKIEIGNKVTSERSAPRLEAS